MERPSERMNGVDRAESDHAIGPVDLDVEDGAQEVSGLHDLAAPDPRRCSGVDVELSLGEEHARKRGAARANDASMSPPRAFSSASICATTESGGDIVSSMLRRVRASTRGAMSSFAMSADFYNGSLWLAFDTAGVVRLGQFLPSTGEWVDVSSQLGSEAASGSLAETPTRACGV